MKKFFIIFTIVVFLIMFIPVVLPLALSFFFSGMGMIIGFIMIIVACVFLIKIFDE